MVFANEIDCLGLMSVHVIKKCVECMLAFSFPPLDPHLRWLSFSYSGDHGRMYILDHGIYTKHKSASYSPAHIGSFACALSRSGKYAISQDNYLHMHRKDGLCVLGADLAMPYLWVCML